MHPLSVFGFLFNYQPLAETILRIVVGIIFLYFAYDKYTHRSGKNAFFEGGETPVKWGVWAIVTVLEGIGGALLFIGLYIQVAALALLIIMIGALIMKLIKKDVVQNTYEFYLLIIFVLIALLFLPPGPWSLDLPL